MRIRRNIWPRPSVNCPFCDYHCSKFILDEGNRFQRLCYRCGEYFYEAVSVSMEAQNEYENKLLDTYAGYSYLCSPYSHHRG